MPVYNDVFVWPLFAGLIGLCIGSLLNVVIYRLPLMMQQEEKALVMDYLSRQSPANPLVEETLSARLNLFLPRSHCPNCQHSLAWYDNIPLISWLLLAGRCRYCRQSVGWVYPVIELVMGLTAILLASYMLPGPNWVMMMAFGSLLLPLAVIDFRHQILPDVLTLSLLWCGLFWQWLVQPDFLGDAVLGAIGGYLALWLLYWGMWFMTRREGLGYGDFKLLAALGAWLGWQKLPEILLLASTATLIVTLVCSKKRENGWSQPQPFGPGLCAAGAFCLIYPLLNL